MNNVPYQVMKNLVACGVGYDSQADCLTLNGLREGIGNLILHLKNTPQWENLSLAAIESNLNSFLSEMRAANWSI